MTPSAHSPVQHRGGHASPAAAPVRYEILLPDGSIEGPLTSVMVRSLAADGAVDTRAQIRRAGDSSWRPITSVAGLPVKAYEPSADRAEPVAEPVAAPAATHAPVAQAGLDDSAEHASPTCDDSSALALESAIADIRAELASARAELEAAHSALDAARTKLDDSRTDLAQARSEATDARAEAADARAALAEARSEIAQLRDDAAMRDAEIAQLRGVAALSRDADAERKSLERTLASEREAFVSALRQGQDQVDAARAAQRELAQEAEAARSRLSAEALLRADAEAARDAARAELEQAARHAQERELDAQDRINRIQLLLDGAQAEMAAERAEAERRAQDMSRRLQEAHAAIRAAEDARSETEAQRLQACAERDEAIRDRDATRLAIGASQTELVHMRGQHDAARAEIAALADARRSLEGRVHELEPQVESERSRAASLEGALARSEDARTSLADTANELRGRIAKLDAQLLQAHIDAERVSSELEDARQQSARELAAQERSASEAIAAAEARAESAIAAAIDEERRAAAERLDAATAAHASEAASLNASLSEERQRVVARDELIFRETLRAEERDREIRSLQDALREERTQALAARDRIAADHAAALGALRLELETAQQRASALERDSARLAASLRAEQESHADAMDALQRKLVEETDALKAAVDREAALRDHAESGARAVLASYEKLADESGRRIADLEVRLSGTTRELEDATSHGRALQSSLEEASARLRSQSQRIGELESERAAADRQREQLEAKLAAEHAGRKKAEGAIAAALQRAERAEKESRATLARAVQSASAALAGIRQRLDEDVERSRAEIDALDALVRTASSQLIAAGGTVPGLPQMPRDAVSAAVVRLIEEQRAADALRVTEQRAAEERAAEHRASAAAEASRLPRAEGAQSALGSIASPRDAIDARARGVPIKLVDDDTDADAAAAGIGRARATPRAPRAPARAGTDPGGGAEGDDPDGAGAAVQPVANQAAALQPASVRPDPAWDAGDVDDGPSSRERCDHAARVIGAVMAATAASATVAALPALRAGPSWTDAIAPAAWVSVAGIVTWSAVTVASRSRARLALRIPALLGASIAAAPLGALFAPLASLPALLGWIACGAGVWFLPWALAWAAWPASDDERHLGPHEDPYRSRRRTAIAISSVSCLGALAGAAALWIAAPGDIASWAAAPWRAPWTLAALAALIAAAGSAAAWRMQPRQVRAARAAAARIDPVVLARHERSGAAAAALLSSMLPLVPAMVAWGVARTRSRRGEAQMRSIVDFEWWSLAALLGAAIAAVLGTGWWPFAGLYVAHGCALIGVAATLASDRVTRLPVPAPLLARPEGGLTLPRPAISVKRAAHASPSRPLVHPCATTWALLTHVALCVAMGLPLLLSMPEGTPLPDLMRIATLLAAAGAASWVPGWIAARLRHADAIAISASGLLAALAAVAVTAMAGIDSAVAAAALWSATLTGGLLLAWAVSALRISPDDAARLEAAVARAQSGDLAAWHADDDALASAEPLEPGEAPPPPPTPTVDLAMRATYARVACALAASAGGLAAAAASGSSLPIQAIAVAASACCAAIALVPPLARPRRSAAWAGAAFAASAACGAVALLVMQVLEHGLAGAGMGMWLAAASATLSMVAAAASWGTAGPGRAAPAPRERAMPQPRAARQPASVRRSPSAKVTTGA